MKNFDRWNIFRQPIIDIGKDFINTFKPYKTHRHWRYDALQPLYGIGYILLGITFLVSAAAMILFAAVLAFVLIYVGIYTYPLQLVGLLALPMLIDLTSYFLQGKTIGFVVGLVEEIKKELVENTIKFIFTLSCIPILIRGSSQLATTPLTWFLKIPLRFLLTQLYEYQKIKEDRGFNRLLDEAEKAELNQVPRSDINKIDQALKQKIDKATNQGREVSQSISLLPDSKYRSRFFKIEKINILEEFPDTKPFFAVNKYKDLPKCEKIQLVASLTQAQQKSGKTQADNQAEQKNGERQTEVAMILKKHGVFVNRTALTMMMFSAKKGEFAQPLNRVPRDIWKLLGEHASVIPKKSVM